MPSQLLELAKRNVKMEDLYFDIAVLGGLSAVLFYLLLGRSWQFFLVWGIAASALAALAWRLCIYSALEAMIKNVESGRFHYDLDTQTWKNREQE